MIPTLLLFLKHATIMRFAYTQCITLNCKGVIIYIPFDAPCHKKPRIYVATGKEFNGFQDMKYFRYCAPTRLPWTVTLTNLLLHYV
jgi:hypothetical protein